jgi:hypothetical protein
MRPFSFSHFTGIDGSILMSDHGDRVATEAEMGRFFRVAEPDLDRLAREMCEQERARGVRLEPWQLEVELRAFLRTQKRAA